MQEEYGNLYAIFFKFIVHRQVKSKLSKSKEEIKFSLNLLTDQDNN